MSWTEDLERICFENNSQFISNYCSPETVLQINQLDEKRISSVRNVAKFFASKHPSLAHSTPGWSSRAGESTPLIAIGQPANAGGGGIRLTSSFGLYLAEEEIRIWVNEDIQRKIPKRYEWGDFRENRKYCNNYTAHQLIHDEGFVTALNNGLKISEQSNGENCVRTSIQWGDDDESKNIVHACTPLMIHIRNRLSHWNRAAN